MSKKKVNIKRADGVVQGYHVGSNVDSIDAPAIPEAADSPYQGSPSEDNVDKAASAFTGARWNAYQSMVDHVKKEEPALYKEYEKLHKGESLTDKGFENILEAVNKKVAMNAFSYDELTDDADKLLSNFGLTDYSTEETSMAIASVITTKSLDILANAYLKEDISNEDYLKSIAVLRISQDILNGNLISKEPWI